MILKIKDSLHLRKYYRTPSRSKGLQHLDGNNANSNMSPMRSVRAFQNVQSGLSSASNSPRGTPVRTFYNRNQQSTAASSSPNKCYYGDTESKYSR